MESDEDEADKTRLLNAKEGIESEEDGNERGKRMSMDEGGSQKKKKKIRQIVESDEESD